MSRYIQMTRLYLLLITVFVLARFVLELVGPEFIPFRDFELERDALASEISLTRLLFVLPVIFGARFVRESLGGLKEMLLANSLYVVWGMILLIALHVVDDTLSLGTHYGRGVLLGVTIGQVISWVGWQMHGGPPTDFPAAGSFCISILLMVIVTNVLCWISIRLNQRIRSVRPNLAGGP